MTSIEGDQVDDGPEVSGPASARLSRASIRTIVGGAVCAALAVLAIIGPANHETATIDWPRPADQMLGPAPVGTPIILAERAPADLRITVPCAALEAPSLAIDSRRTLLATARNPFEISGLVLSSVGTHVVVGVGQEVLAQFDVPDAGRPSCRISAQFDGERWSVAIDGRVIAGGDQPSPILSGLYTDVPSGTAGASASPSVTLVTRNETSSPSGLQVMATIGSLVVGAVVLGGLVRSDGRRLPSFRWKRPAIRLSDVIVMLALPARAVLSGPLSDDGWIMASVANKQASGSFGSYYDAFNSPAPLGFLHSMLFHAMSPIGTGLGWFRVPAVVCWWAAWWIGRGMLDRALVANAEIVRRVARAAFVSVFLITVLASGITVRPEFLTGLLIVVVVRLMERFRDTPGVLNLAIPVVVAAIAVTVHPIGFVCVAPFLLNARVIWRWLRADSNGALFSVAGAGLVGLGTALLIVFADSDTKLWRASLDLTALTQVHDGGVTDEWKRYQLLFGHVWGTPLMRLTFLLPALACLSALVRWVIGRRQGVAAPPSYVALYAAAIAAMSLNPSKWPIHLSALAILGALACATEVAAIAVWPIPTVPKATRSRLATVGSLIIVGVLCYVAFVWHGTHETWVAGSYVDGWLIEGVPRIYLWSTVAVMAVAALVIALRARHHRDPTPAWPARRTLPVLLPTLVAIAIVPTLLGSFVFDAATTPTGWAISRQLVGMSPGSCGVASVATVGMPLEGKELALAVPRSFPDTKGLTMVSATPPIDVSGWWEPHGEVAPASHGRVTTPWQKLSDADHGALLEFWTAGTWWSDSRATVHVEFGRSEGAEVRTVRSGKVHQQRRWRFLTSEKWLPTSVDVTMPADADRIRLVAEKLDPVAESEGGTSSDNSGDSDDGESGDPWLGISSLASVPERSLERLIRESPTLIDPSMRPYFPCARRSVIERGIVEVPTFTIESARTAGQGMTLFGRSPFYMETDAYGLPFMTLPVRTRGDDGLVDLPLEFSVAWTDPTELRPFGRPTS